MTQILHRNHVSSSIYCLSNNSYVWQDDEGRTGIFIDKIEELAKADRRSYIREIEDQLGSKT